MTRFDPPRHARSEKPVALDAPGVLMPFELERHGHDDAIFFTADHSVPVTCPLRPPAELAGRIWRAHVKLRDEPDGLLTVVSAHRDDSLDPLALIPPSACRLPGVVAEFLKMVGSIQTPALRDVVRDTFEVNDVFENFWRVRAAPDHHHWKGGLAFHTLEVARAIAAAFDRPASGHSVWSSVERDLGLVAALLHDVAECADEGRPSAPGVEARRHACGIRRPELVRPALDNLFRRDRTLGNALLELWCPTLGARTSAVRTAEMHMLLSASHRLSETSTVRPLPQPHAVLLDRMAGCRQH